MNTFKKIALGLALLSLSARARALTTEYTLGYSTAAATVVQLSSGSGTVSQVVLGTGTIGDYCVWFDTDAWAVYPTSNPVNVQWSTSATNSLSLGLQSIPGIVALSSSSSYSPGTVRLGELFFSSTTVTSSSAGMYPSIPFYQGVAFLCRSARNAYLFITQP